MRGINLFQRFFKVFMFRMHLLNNTLCFRRENWQYFFLLNRRMYLK